MRAISAREYSQPLPGVSRSPCDFHRSVQAPEECVVARPPQAEGLPHPSRASSCRCLEAPGEDQTPRFWACLGQHDGALHGVLKLAHIAGPRIGEQPIQGCSREAARSAVVHRASTSDEAMSERQNVFAASPKRRYFDADHLQPIVEVLTKGLLANHLSEISICRGNDSHIHRPIVCPANAAYLVILKNAEKLYLY